MQCVIFGIIFAESPKSLSVNLLQISETLQINNKREDWNAPDQHNLTGNPDIANKVENDVKFN